MQEKISSTDASHLVSKHQKTPSTTFTLRITRIPDTVSRDDLYSILEENVEHTDDVVHVSLAPAPSTLDSQSYQVATVCFREITSKFRTSKLYPDPHARPVVLEYGGHCLEVDVDDHFFGLTPLSELDDPQVE